MSHEIKRIKYFPPKTTQYIFIFLLLTTVAWCYSQVFPLSFHGTDNYRLITAAVNPNSDTLTYWMERFTTPTNYVQYRPVSFFAYLYIIRSLFDADISAFNLANLMVFLISIFCVFQLLLKVSNNLLIVGGATIFYAFHPTQAYLFWDITFPFKYFAPMAILSVLLLWSIQGRLQTSIKTLIACLLIGLSIGIHEASFLFPFMIVISQWAWKKNISKKVILLFIPSFIYLIARLCFFGMPSDNSFLAVDLTAIPTNIFYYWSIVWDFTSYYKKSAQNLWIFAAVVSIFIWFSVNEIKTNQDRRHLFALSLSLLLILPFTLLKTHIYYSRASWDLLGAALALTLLATKFYNKAKERGVKTQRLTETVILLFVANLLLQNFIHHEGRVFHSRKWLKVLQSELKIKIENINSISQIDYIGNQFTLISPKGSEHAIRQVLPGFLALHYPDKKFIIQHNPNALIPVLNNTYFYCKSFSQCIDPFNHSILIPNEGLQDLNFERITKSRGHVLHLPNYF